MSKTVKEVVEKSMDIESVIAELTGVERKLYQKRSANIYDKIIRLIRAQDEKIDNLE